MFKVYDLMTSALPARAVNDKMNHDRAFACDAGCSGCSGCTGCTGCSNCTGCSDCTGASGPCSNNSGMGGGGGGQRQMIQAEMRANVAALKAELQQPTA